MKRIICSLLLLAMLGITACSAEMPAAPAGSGNSTEMSAGSEKPTEMSAGSENPTEMSAQPAGGEKILDGRWLNPDIIGNVAEDTPAELKDNFALYVNKDWILSATLPEGVASITSLAEAGLIVIDRQMKMLTDDSLTGHDAELVHKLYALVSDWD